MRFVIITAVRILVGSQFLPSQQPNLSVFVRQVWAESNQQHFRCLSFPVHVGTLRVFFLTPDGGMSSDSSQDLLSFLSPPCCPSMPFQHCSFFMNTVFQAPKKKPGCSSFLSNRVSNYCLLLLMKRFHSFLDIFRTF